MNQLTIFDTDNKEQEATLFSNTMLTEVTVGGIYELDNIRYRLTKWRASGVHTFQELNADGTDYITYKYNSDGEPTQVDDYGTRLFCNRFPAMVRVG